MGACFSTSFSLSLWTQLFLAEERLFEIPYLRLERTREREEESFPLDNKSRSRKKWTWHRHQPRSCCFGWFFPAVSSSKTKTINVSSSNEFFFIELKGELDTHISTFQFSFQIFQSRSPLRYPPPLASSLIQT